jgi:hypothetical protein
MFGYVIALRKTTRMSKYYVFGARVWCGYHTIIEWRDCHYNNIRLPAEEFMMKLWDFPASENIWYGVLL